MHEIMKMQGYEKLESKVGSNNGYDGLYVKRDSKGRVTEVVIGEAKYGRARLGTTIKMGKQMSNPWIEGNLEKMKNSVDPNVLKAYSNIKNKIPKGR